MDRLEHLTGIYLKISYFQYDEEKQSQPSGAVLEACRIFKTLVWAEYYQIVDARAGRKPKTQSASYNAALTAVGSTDIRGNA